MGLRLRRLAALCSLVACGPGHGQPSTTDDTGSSSASSGNASEPPTSPGDPGSSGTFDPPTTDAPVTTSTSDTTSTTSTTSTTDGTSEPLTGSSGSSGDPPTFPPPACPTLCETPVTHEGDLLLQQNGMNDDLVCVTHITGDLSMAPASRWSCRTTAIWSHRPPSHRTGGR